MRTFFVVILAVLIVTVTSRVPRNKEVRESAWRGIFYFLTAIPSANAAASQKSALVWKKEAAVFAGYQQVSLDLIIQIGSVDFMSSS